MTEKFHIFTPGPVRMAKDVLMEGKEQLPYFRTHEFSAIIAECERMMLNFTNAPEGSRVLFLSASGSGAMEAAVINLLGDTERGLVINGGSFGQRFTDIINAHRKKGAEIKLSPGKSLAPSDLDNAPPDFSALFINGHETSTGVLYDLEMVSDLAKKRNALFIVDAISMFMTDPVDMERLSIDLLIVSSQKGLGLPPGLSLMVVSPEAQYKIMDREGASASFYFNLSSYLKDQERHQTPFTPPVGIINQLHRRLKSVEKTGIHREIERAERVARHFRERIAPYPLSFFSQRMPNAMTALSPTDGKKATDIVNRLLNEFSIFVCPNGGNLADRVFRVGHMGDVDEGYTDILLDAFEIIYNKEKTA